MCIPLNTDGFPIDKQGEYKMIPELSNIQVGDIIVSRYSVSRWANNFPWENWHHAALVSKITPLTIIEAAGVNSEGQPSGPFEVEFWQSVSFGKATDIEEIRWLKPIFPNPIREIASWKTLRINRKIITENEARKRVIAYAREQIGEPYKSLATKWSEDSWYCSLLVYKSYSRTITGMRLENYDIARGGPLVTPEDLIDSRRTKEYFAWKHKKIA